MADLSTPSAATMSTMDAGSDKPEKQQKIRPEKPDEQVYKESLAKAEKDHTAAQEKLVRVHMLPRKISGSQVVADHHWSLFSLQVHILERYQGKDRPCSTTKPGFPRWQTTTRTQVAIAVH